MARAPRFTNRDAMLTAENSLAQLKAMQRLRSSYVRSTSGETIVFRNGSESSLNAVCRSGEPISAADPAPQLIQGPLPSGTRPVPGRWQEGSRYFLPSRYSQ
jgi:hypothetical protein